MKDESIFIVVPNLSAGGAERVTVLLANYWVSQGRQVTLVLFEPLTKNPFYDVDDRVGRVVLPGSGQSFFGRNLSRIQAMRRLFHCYPGQVISMMTYVNIIVLISSLFTSVRPIISERIDPRWDGLPFSWRIIRRALYPFARKIVVQTGASGEYFRRWMRGKVYVIANPIDLSSFDGVETKPQQKELIVAIGRLEEQKAHKDLIEAFARLPEEIRRGKQLLIYGEGSQRPMLEERINKLGVSKLVSLPGITRDIPSVLAQASLFVLSSRFEGFPNVLVEAMASGCAVISTDCPSGPSDLINDGENGTLVPVGDIDQLSFAMAELLRDPKRRLRFGVAARISVEELDLPVIASQWEAMMN